MILILNFKILFDLARAIDKTERALKVRLCHFENKTILSANFLLFS